MPGPAASCAGAMASVRGQPVREAAASHMLLSMFRRSASAYAFLAFPLAVLFLFTLIPTIAGVGLSLFRWDGGSDPVFVGGRNFAGLLDDPRFLPALWNTIRYAAATVPVTVFLGFLLALALHATWFRGKALIQAAIFLPTVVSIVAIGFMWRWLLNDEGGLIPAMYIGVVNQLEAGSIRPAFVPLRPPNFLHDGDWPMRWIMVATVWRGVGFCMILYLAALKAIPFHLYEAAAVDGATDRELARHITWPLVGPMTVFLLVTGVISSLQVFDMIWGFTAGAESASTRVLNLLVYREFQQSRLGYASAIGAVILVLTLTATAGQLLIFRRNVTAGDEP